MLASDRRKEKGERGAGTGRVRLTRIDTPELRTTCDEEKAATREVRDLDIEEGIDLYLNGTNSIKK